MTTILEQIIAGKDLIAEPPTVPSGAWHYTIGGERVIITTTDMLIILRSGKVSSERLAKNKLRYYYAPPKARKLSRKQRREARTK